MKKQKKDYLEKIALSLIIKYDEPPEMVERSIASVAPVVDGIFLTITKNNPKDDTSAIERIAKKFNANVSFFDWIDDFAAARNFAFAKIPKKEFGWIYWHDVDDILQGIKHFPAIFKDTIIHGWDAVYFSYWYNVDLDENGKVREIVVEHKRERIVRNDGCFKWIGRIHETLIEQRKAVKMFRDECIIVHLTSSERQDVNIDRNIRILEKTLKAEDKKDPRTVMYLAKAYYDRSKSQKKEGKRKIDIELSRNLFFEYLEGVGKPGSTDYREPSGWDEERSQAWAYLSEIARAEGQFNAAIKCAFNATEEAPKFPGYYLDLAMCYTYKRDWEKADHWLRVALHVPQPNTTLITNPRDIKSRALEIDYHIAFAKRDLPRAERAVSKLKEILPDMKALDERLTSIQQLIMANKAAQSVAYLSRVLEISGEQHKIPDLIQAIPKEIAQETFVSQMRHKFMPPRLWEKNEIAIMCGPGFEKWSPKNLKDGIGGSEEAVIYLSRELTSLGYKVIVYADPREDVGDYDGVTYRPFHEMNPKDSFNILILWRAVGFVDQNFSAKQTYLWLHDVPTNPEFTKERIDKIDKIFVLSEYHKSLLRMSDNGKIVPIPEEKLFVTGNGISEININKKWGRDPNKLIWGSSYDRGLPYLLQIWPQVKKAIPDATLDIYYGWNLYDVAHAGNPARTRWKDKVNKMMQQEGITHHGRVGHKELHKAYAQAGIWAYPTDFQEISCISAMKSAAFGAIPVTTNFAALKETVRHGIKVDVDITEKAGQKEYTKALIKFMKQDPEEIEKIRETMMKDAQEFFPWSGIAKQWDKLFKNK